MKNLQNILEELINDFFLEASYDPWHLYNQEVDIEKDFANYAKETIEVDFGEDEFDDYNIKSYAIEVIRNYYENKQQLLLEEGK